MAFATAADVATRLGRPLTDAQEDAAEFVIELVEGAITEIDGHATADITPVPAYYKALCVEKAIEVLSRPEPAIASESLGAHSVTYARETLGGIFLTEYEERQVRRIANNKVSASIRTEALPHDVYVTEVE